MFECLNKGKNYFKIIRKGKANDFVSLEVNKVELTSEPINSIEEVMKEIKKIPLLY